MWTVKAREPGNGCAQRQNTKRALVIGSTRLLATLMSTRPRPAGSRSRTALSVAYKSSLISACPRMSAV